MIRYEFPLHNRLIEWTGFVSKWTEYCNRLQRHGQPRFNNMNGGKRHGNETNGRTFTIIVCNRLQ
ncbi:hypothetical protein PAECIP111802_05090 [Paenibacillus allorhizosphaerae]|uniref:Transposase n=1 Tax=Paenibacillus allorhizosphaerae TaxID=2849866 RepID=A0ABN7TU64_9BACL|nr:hypothetical protein PAECIP111802_05090 [Paenibacillus allorhizosphaerae]